jgi:RNA polymerase primary sigma factor
MTNAPGRAMGHRPPDRWYENAVRRAPGLAHDEERTLTATLEEHRGVIARHVLGSEMGLAYLRQLRDGLAARAIDVRNVVEVEADARVENVRDDTLARLDHVDRLGARAARHRLPTRTRCQLERALRELPLRRAHVDAVVARMEAARPATAAALAALRTAGDAAARARARLVESHLRLVVAIARRHANRGLDLPDLVQEGTIGLMRAIDRFDAGRRVTFATYAAWWVRQTMGRALENRARPVRLPGTVEDGLRKVRRQRRHLTLQQARTPSNADIALCCELPVARVDELVRIERELCQPMLSFEVGDPDDVDGRAPADVIADASRPGPEEAAIARHLSSQASRALRTLAPREREVLRLRYGIGHAGEHTLEDIGRRYGLTRQRILQIASKALDKLRASRHATPLRSFWEP